ncbi:ankyrin repeat domain-containing protein [Burkholderiaceae bacterium DAT-1]|nr:ankyrin repeat domain-containing protein [Burkholderiaceae bacterium DAT-1]
MTTKETAIPRLGQALRTVIKFGGYRSYLVECGLDKNLDDLAAEARDRQASAFDVMRDIEDACTKALAADCGYEWAQFFEGTWIKTREALQFLAQHVDISPLPLNQGSTLFQQYFAMPMLSGFLGLVVRHRNGGSVDAWLDGPFKSWLALAASRTCIAEQTLLIRLANELDADPRTIERWLAGEPIGKLVWPYAPKVKAILGSGVTESDLHFLTGWLLVACALQSISFEIREGVRRDYVFRKQHPWTLAQTVDTMNRAALNPDNWPPAALLIPLLQEIEQLFDIRPHDALALQENLEQLRQLIRRSSAQFKTSFQPVHDWFLARGEALLGKREAALRLYASAVDGAWWCVGQNQHPILNEALLYAVGVGDKNAANAYWDKTFMLGLNRGPKRPLDDQETRRIAFAFEQKFYPQKAKDRIPPATEYRGQDYAFHLGTQHLAKPNQKTKYAEGRTRRTPLMVAIFEGTLGEVQQLIAAGGNPNDFIPESGEGPLSYAMRRACDRKDTIIMEYLLGLDLTPETVNRPASTMRETPLKIAIEMANAPAVARLIELGANVEAPCDYCPSALCYAMSLFHGSLHRNDYSQSRAFFAGKIRGDVYDAKKGGVLDADLAHCRHDLLRKLKASDRNRRLWEGVRDYFIRPAADHRAVIQALLIGGADANRRYRVEEHDVAEWTPTLFAAQTGDLDVFRMLVEHPGGNHGDPDMTLMRPKSLERFDALWVAIDHGRHPIVSYLIEREKQHARDPLTP